MSDDSRNKDGEGPAALAREVGARASRKLRARRDSAHGLWFGLGMMGLVGWSVVVPTLLGAALGIWLDNRYPTSHSWTLSLLVIGLVIGCVNAWYWLQREDQAMRQDQGAQEDRKDPNG